MNINYLNFNNTTKIHDGKVPYISSTKLDGISFIKNGFSTRLGGVSKGEYTSMNLTFTRGDDTEAVKTNFRIIGETLNVLPSDMVYAQQVHSTNILKVNDAHRGMGVVKERTYSDIDGLITNVPGITLVTSYADCVPLYFVDVKNKAIGLSHSGWKGTVKNICHETVKAMHDAYNTKPENLITFIGPSICRDCYEISEDVAKEFAMAYGIEVFSDILYPKKNDKYQLDLHMANYHNMINEGIPKENISITDICTCCNPKILFSHRAEKGRRGGLCGFLSIKEDV